MRRAASETLLSPLLTQLLLAHLQQQHRRQAMTTVAAMASAATSSGRISMTPNASSSSIFRHAARKKRVLISPRHSSIKNPIAHAPWLSRPLSASSSTPTTPFFSSSALPALDAARSEAEDDDRAPAAGRFVEFLTKSGGGGGGSSSSSSSTAPSTSFALLLEPDGKRNWFAVDARGTRHSLKPAQITYVFPDEGPPLAPLPSSGARLEVLKEAAEAAERAATPGSEDLSLLRDAWEMTAFPEEGSSAPLLTAPALADLLYGDAVSPASIASVLRLMSSPSPSTPPAELDDARTLFKQVGRRPPAWTPRSEADVKAIRGAARAAEAAAEALRAAAEALREAASASAASSSSSSSALQTPEQWLSGPHSKFVEALDAFALEKATQAQASLAQGLLRALGPLPARVSSALMESVVVGALSDPSPTNSNNGSIRAPFPPTSDGAAALLSAVGLRPRHEIPSLRRAGLTEEFPRELEAAAAELLGSSSPSRPPSSPDPDDRWRLDLTQTHRFVVAIDDASTTEVDDAISVERGGEAEDNGESIRGISAPARNTKPIAIWVHVADPTRWVTGPEHPLAQEASRRTRTLYLPTGSLPMFPRSAAERLFSLSRVGESDAASVPAFSVRLPINADGTRDESLEATIHVTSIRPATRMTYEEADAVLKGEGRREDAAREERDDDLAVVAAFADSRLASRRARGAASFDLPELCVIVSSAEARTRGGEGGSRGSGGGRSGSGVSIELSQLWSGESASRRAVAEAMIAANEAVALWGGRHGVPLPYRGQPEPISPVDSESEAESSSSSSPSIEVDENGDDDENRSGGGGEAMTAAELVAAYSRLFSSQRSTLSTDAPARHSGLGLEAYVQSTSPIRRYSDLVAHWQAKAKLRQLESLAEGNDSPSPTHQLPWPDPASLSAELSGAAETARELSRAERAATNHWVGRYFAEMSSTASPDPKPTWKATLVSWVRKETGLARVLLRDLGVESTLRVNGPAKLGDELTLAHVGTDEVSGGPLFDDVSCWSGSGGSSGSGSGSVGSVGDEELAVEEEEEEEEEVVADEDADEVASSAVVSEEGEGEK